MDHPGIQVLFRSGPELHFSFQVIEFIFILNDLSTKKTGKGTKNCGELVSILSVA